MLYQWLQRRSVAVPNRCTFVVASENILIFVQLEYVLYYMGTKLNHFYEGGIVPRERVNKRIWLTTEASKIDAMADMADRYGIPVSVYVGMCAWIGHKTMVRTLEPESAYTPEQMVKMFIAAKAQGLDVQEPDSEELKRMIADENRG